jgi:ppGpp synthetase/RelA/SpoT-type nucleotidyltranferase
VLREEYFDLLPDIRRTTEELEAEVRFLLVPVSRKLARHERIVVKSRVKECESAIASLKRRTELWELEDARSIRGSLAFLNDLAGIRILAFPKGRVLEIDNALRARFWDWTADPVPPTPGAANSIALKYHGYCSRPCRVRSEIQLMSMLVGMFWEVEHAALYKPSAPLRGMEVELKMQHRYADVIRTLDEFEAEFESLANAALAAADADAHEC